MQRKSQCVTHARFATLQDVSESVDVLLAYVSLAGTGVLLV